MIVLMFAIAGCSVDGTTSDDYKKTEDNAAGGMNQGK